MPPSSVRILVIEDNTPDVLLIGESLLEEGVPHEITHYRDGEEALVHMRNSDGETPSYDLVILDLNMPKLGGLDVLARIRDSPEFKLVPFLVLTSSLAPDEQQEAKRLGADRYLKKPADLYQFLAEVGSAVREMVQGRMGIVQAGTEIQPE